MRDLIRRIIGETVTNKEVICDKCGWSWDISDGGDDLYTVINVVTITHQNLNLI
jgi:hypothetical protein